MCRIIVLEHVILCKSCVRRLYIVTIRSNIIVRYTIGPTCIILLKHQELYYYVIKTAPLCYPIHHYTRRPCIALDRAWQTRLIHIVFIWTICITCILVQRVLGYILVYNANPSCLAFLLSHFLVTLDNQILSFLCTTTIHWSLLQL